MNPSSNIPPQSTDNQLLQRDGTSQAGRIQGALAPDYVSVDERSLQDLLAFAREYAKELQYFDVENGVVRAMGDWSEFLSSKLDIDEVVDFMQEPENFSPEKARPYTRPHFVLFLTILQLLRHAQDGLNTLTRRHLDFYYQQVLRMTKRPGVPDQVNVLVDLAPGTEQFPLPAGTLLNAGADSLGQDVFYRTERDIVVNHAQVARLSSVYAEKRVIGIREAREGHDGPEYEKFVKMLEMALGDPAPGDPLPKYPEGKPDDKTVDYPLLKNLYEIVNFVSNSETGLSMQFDEFRQLMRLKTQRDGADEEWKRINAILEKALRTRTKKPDEQFEPQNLRDFNANLRTALGDPSESDFDGMFDGIPEVKNIDDAYDKREREDLKNDIRARIWERLYLVDMTDFTAMMQIKVKIDKEWQEINRILEVAGQRKRNEKPSFEDSTAFDFCQLSIVNCRLSRHRQT